MRTDDLDYTLPAELIATEPAPRREGARLLVVDPADPRRPEHRLVSDLPGFFRPGDALTLNNTRVHRARLAAVRADTGGHVTGLFLGADPDQPCRWTLMLRAGSTLLPGHTLTLCDPAGAETTASLTLESKDAAGIWTASATPNTSPADLEHLGRVPLPPYILKARHARGLPADLPTDAERYQTVFADPRMTGSVAAPTAGLHLTDSLLGSITAAGARVDTLTLHVGAGTFKPIDTGTLAEHPMHAERFAVPASALRSIDRARADGARSIVVGTTTARALESVPAGHLDDWAGTTDILIAPGHPWSRTDALLTNFHLPRSTLLAMVAALFPGGIDDLLLVYDTAIEHRYRFFSFGDAMLILPDNRPPTP